MIPQALLASLLTLSSMASPLRAADLQAFWLSLLPLQALQATLQTYWPSLLASTICSWLAARAKFAANVPQRVEDLSTSWLSVPYLVWGYQASREALYWPNTRAIYQWRSLLTALLAFVLVTLVLYFVTRFGRSSKEPPLHVPPGRLLVLLAIVLTIVLDHVFPLLFYIPMSIED